MESGWGDRCGGQTEAVPCCRGACDVTQEEEMDDPSNTTVASENPKLLPNADAYMDTNNLDVQTQVPGQTKKWPTFMELLCGEEDFDLLPFEANEAEGNNYNYAETMSLLGNNPYDIWTGGAQLEPQEHMVTLGYFSGIGSQLPGSQTVKLLDGNIGSCLASPRDNQLQGGHLALLMSYISAFAAPDQQIPTSLVMRQSIEQPAMSHSAIQKSDNVNSTSGIGHSDCTFDTGTEEMFGGVANLSPSKGDLGLQGGHLALLMSNISAFAPPDQQIPTRFVRSRSIKQLMASHCTIQKSDAVNSTSGIGHSDCTFETVSEKMFGGGVNLSLPNGDPDKQIPTSFVRSRSIKQLMASHSAIQKSNVVNSTGGIGHPDCTFETVSEEMFGGGVNLPPPNGDHGPF
uniref:Uncharacterized protein n=1 Tax=Leersia perrieri TaxID=77586 RepID=A0A0D9W293_9ORYZ